MSMKRQALSGSKWLARPNLSFGLSLAVWKTPGRAIRGHILPGRRRTGSCALFGSVRRTMETFRTRLELAGALPMPHSSAWREAAPTARYPASMKSFGQLPAIASTPSQPERRENVTEPPGSKEQPRQRFVGLAGFVHMFLKVSSIPFQLLANH